MNLSIMARIQRNSETTLALCHTTHNAPKRIKGLSKAGDLTLSLNAFETGLPRFATTAVVVFLMWYSEKLNIPYFQPCQTNISIKIDTTQECI